jgi:adenylate cyclase 2
LSNFEMSENSEPGNNGPGQVISSVRSIRLAIFIITTCLISACAVFNVLDISQVDDIPIEIESTTASQFINDTDFLTNFTSLNFNSSFSTTDSSIPIATSTESMTRHTEISPIYLFLCGLSLSAISAFLRAGFIMKLIVMILTVLVQTTVLYMSRLFEEYDYFKYQDNNSSM